MSAAAAGGPTTSRHGHGLVALVLALVVAAALASTAGALAGDGPRGPWWWAGPLLAAAVLAHLERHPEEA